MIFKMSQFLVTLWRAPSLIISHSRDVDTTTRNSRGTNSSAHQITQVEKHFSGNVKTCRVLARCQALGSNLGMDYISDSGHAPSTNEQLAKEAEKASHSFLIL